MQSIIYPRPTVCYYTKIEFLMLTTCNYLSRHSAPYSNRNLTHLLPGQVDLGFISKAFATPQSPICNGKRNLLKIHL